MYTPAFDDTIDDKMHFSQAQQELEEIRESQTGLHVSDRSSPRRNESSNSADRRSMAGAETSFFEDWATTNNLSHIAQQKLK